MTRGSLWNVKKISGRVLLWSTALLAGACQSLYTGEPVMYGSDPTTGALLDRDIVGAAASDAATGSGGAAAVVPHTNEMISLTLSSVFLRYVAGLGDPHVLVYAQVYDDGTDSPESAYTRILYNEEGTPGGAMLGFADRTLYGPTPFKGYPIRVKLTVVRLNKTQKEQTAKLISTVGTTGSALAPQYGPAIAIVVDALKAINELTRDDFELRFDLTLYPVGVTGAPATVGDKYLDGSMAPDGQREPVQRVGKAVTLVSPLRDGAYVVIKREIVDRGGNRVDAVASRVSRDWTQECQTDSFGGVEADYVLRLQGGYLYKVYRGVPVFDKNGVLMKYTSATVRRSDSRSSLTDFAIAPGVRELFDDQTYAVLTVVRGLPAAVSPEQMRASAQREAKALGELLINPTGSSTASSLNASVDTAANSIKSLLQLRRLSELAAARVRADPAYRTAPAYAVFWSSQLRTTPPAAGSPLSEADQAANRLIWDTLGSFVRGLPPNLDPAKLQDATQIAAWKAENFVAVEGRPGLFDFKAGAQ